MAENGWDLLYIHPYNHPEDAFIPAGVLANYNSVSVPKRGFYAFEVPPEALRQAKLIGLTLHWGIAIGSLKPILAHIRKVNPKIKIVLGGITASFFAPLLVERLGVDYVIQGDGEPVFPALVEAVLAGKEPENVPNLHTSRGPPPQRERLTQAQFDAQDPLTCDWFPSYRRLTHMDGAMAQHLFAVRGCGQFCEICYGSHAPQSFGPGIPFRSPDALLHDMERVQEDLRVSNLSITMFSLPKHLVAAYREIFSKPWRFSLSINICSPLDEELVRRVAAHAASKIAFSVTWPEDIPAIRNNPKVLEREVETLTRMVIFLKKARPDCHFNVYYGRAHTPERLAAFRAEAAGVDLLIQDTHYFELTRPMYSLLQQGVGLAEQLEAVEDLSLEYRHIRLARLASPVFRHWLAPIGTMDGHFHEGWNEPPANPALRPFWDVFDTFWKRHSYAGLPGLRLGLIPVKETPSAWNGEEPTFDDWGLADRYRLEGRVFYAAPPAKIEPKTVRWAQESQREFGLIYDVPPLPENAVGFIPTLGLERADGTILPFLPGQGACFFVSVDPMPKPIRADILGTVLRFHQGSETTASIALDSIVDYVHPTHPRPWVDPRPKEFYDGLTDPAFPIGDLDALIARLDKHLREPFTVKLLKGARCTEVKNLGGTLGLRFERPDTGEYLYIGVQALIPDGNGRDGLRCRTDGENLSGFCRLLERVLPKL